MKNEGVPAQPAASGSGKDAGVRGGRGIKRSDHPAERERQVSRFFLRAEWRVQAFCGAKPWRKAEFTSAAQVQSFMGSPRGLLRGAAAKMLEFEVAAALRDQIIQLRGQEK